MLRIAYAPLYCHPLPEGHRFPMAKYELIPAQLLYEGTITPEHLFNPIPATDEAILRIHDPAYYQRIQHLTLTTKEERRIGFPQSAALAKREVLIAGGTIACAHYALEHGVAMNVAGGTHHAFYEHGEGFCLLNDIAIAAQHLLDNGRASQIIVVDLDVHQGNGTARLFANEPRVFTFSMHGANNYPLHKEHSDLDIPLPDHTDDDTYLCILRDTLPNLLDEVAPDFVFYLSGVDVLSTDKLGKLGMTIAGCKARDVMVFEECFRRRLPVAVSMGGGYSVRLANIVEAHANTFRAAQAIYF